MTWILCNRYFTVFITFFIRKLSQHPKFYLIEAEDNSNDADYTEEYIEDSRDNSYESVEIFDHRCAHLFSNTTYDEYSGRRQCKCSKIPEPAHRKITMRGKSLGLVNNDYSQDYVVGGYNVSKPRPWMALILTSDEPSKVMKFARRCGGALINKRYILTASHCVCTGPKFKLPYWTLPCEEGGKNSGKILYNPKLHHWVLLGINNEDKGPLTYVDTKHFYEVESVVQNPKFRNKKMPEDIALIRLGRDAEFKINHIMPICLPSKDDDTDIKIAKKMDKNNRVYSSGWGLLKKMCTTDGSGPIKHIKCDVHEVTDNPKCYNTPPPIKKEGLCVDFRKDEPENYPKKKDTRIRIIDRKNKKQEICYAEITGPIGWCNTVMKEPVYNNWGWCNPTVCNQDSDMANRLKEVRMMLLPLKDCEYFEHWNQKQRNGTDVFDEKAELCAGTKRDFTKLLSYIKIKNRKKQKYEYISKIGEVILNLTSKGHLERMNYKLDYYLGGGDTCSGDSGGPLYTWIKGVPTVIGVVSRGGGYGPNRELMEGCGEINYPGIYTRVSKYLEWIHKNTKDGQC